jgi:hypothetical protein
VALVTAPEATDESEIERFIREMYGEKLRVLLNNPPGVPELEHLYQDAIETCRRALRGLES